MSARYDKWMPLYWGDYLRDTMHLRAEGHGAYLLLLGACWLNGGSVPDDDDQLAAIARCDAKQWQRLRPILAKFFQVVGGQWVQGRLTRELARSKHLAEAKQNAGKAGGRAKAERVAGAQQTPTPLPLPPHPPSEDSPRSPPAGGGVVVIDHGGKRERGNRRPKRPRSLREALAADPEIGGEVEALDGGGFDAGDGSAAQALGRGQGGNGEGLRQAAGLQIRGPAEGAGGSESGDSARGDEPVGRVSDAQNPVSGDRGGLADQDRPAPRLVGVEGRQAGAAVIDLTDIPPSLDRRIRQQG